MTPEMVIPPRLSAVLFDLDGVLIDSRKSWHLTIDEVARRAGHAPVSYARFAGTFGQGVSADRRDFFPSLALEAVDQQYREVFGQHLDHVELMPGAMALLGELRQRGYRLAVVTNTPLPLAQQVLERKGLAAHLHAVAAGGEAKEKPAPDLIQLALTRLGHEPTQVVYVGDSSSDLGAAGSAGVFFFGYGGIAGDGKLTRLSDLLRLIPEAAGP